MNTTLQDVQENIRRQLFRDYSYMDPEDLQQLSIVGLCEEVGEVAGLLKRKMRSNHRDIERLNYFDESLIEELGDVLWYLTACCEAYSFSLEDIWKNNKAKLEERYGKV